MSRGVWLIVFFVVFPPLAIILAIVWYPTETLKTLIALAIIAVLLIALTSAQQTGV